MRVLACLAVLLVAPAGVGSADPEPAPTFQPSDVFELEWASDPRIAPDGSRIAYVRNGMDIMKDRRRSTIWIIDADGGNHRALVADHDASSPRWSPEGDRLLYLSSDGDTTQLHLMWMDTGQSAKITSLTEGPSGLAWSPDGKWIAFSMLARRRTEPFAKLPPKPEGAEWADPPVVIDRLHYRRDGTGYLKDGFRHIFVVPAEGGTPRQVTSGDFDHGAAPSWTPDGKALLVSANRNEDWEYRPNGNEIFEVTVDDGTIRALTSRDGPDENPVVSPDGKYVAYVGFDDRCQGFQVVELYVMNRDGSNPRSLTAKLDRSVSAPAWTADSKGLLFLYANEGNGKVGRASLDGAVQELAADVGGLSLGRPYSSGQFSVARNGRFAFTRTRPDHPADLAVGGPDRPKVITRLNEDLLGHKSLAPLEEIWWESSFDKRRIHGWIAKPPGFDPKKKYPMILEIHGGPFANYGDRFAAEIQLYAASGYVVFYANPRGSTSYGGAFGNLIHHAYPGNDYDDLMSGVDAVLEQGYVDPERLFVTGGSGGGVLSAWIVGKTDRFKAAVIAKPVVNWHSFVLTTDYSNFFCKYWFSQYPWENPDEYVKRSPLSLVGNVKTPSMLLTGENDYRTPMSESEQYYQALKLRKVDAALVRIPGASHGIARRPSQLIAKVVHVLAWFERYDRPRDGE